MRELYPENAMSLGMVDESAVACLKECSTLGGVQCVHALGPVLDLACLWIVVKRVGYLGRFP